MGEFLLILFVFTVAAWAASFITGTARRRWTYVALLAAPAALVWLLTADAGCLGDLRTECGLWNLLLMAALLIFPPIGGLIIGLIVMVRRRAEGGARNR